MRILGHIYTNLLNQEGVVQQHKNALDIFVRENFPKLREAIDKYTSNDDDSVKAGLKQNVYYLLKRSAKTLRALKLEEGNERTANQVAHFIELLELWDDLMFGGAVYETNKRREVCMVIFNFFILLIYKIQQLCMIKIFYVHTFLFC